jgi:hypothetical protein
MNSIAKALNNIAISINRLADAVISSKKIESSKQLPALKAETSNGLGHVTITSQFIETPHKPSQTNFDLGNSSKMVRVFQEEKDALEAIYKALSDKEKYPHHHDVIMRELSTKWPVLHSALNKLLIVRKDKYNKQSYDIWKNPKNKW